MTVPDFAKAIREGYSPAPFFFQQEYAPDSLRWVAWSPTPTEVKNVVYRSLDFFPDDVEVLLKVAIQDSTDSTGESLQRYHAVCALADLVEAIRRSELFIFIDGGSQLCVRPHGGGDYMALDDHGIFFMYSCESGYPEFFQQLGFQHRVEELLYDQPHWHRRPPNPDALAEEFITKLGLLPV
jgi:hypothetical protein